MKKILLLLFLIGCDRPYIEETNSDYMDDNFIFSTNDSVIVMTYNGTVFEMIPEAVNNYSLIKPTAGNGCLNITISFKAKSVYTEK